MSGKFIAAPERAQIPETIREQLIEMGIPADQIAFMQHAGLTTEFAVLLVSATGFTFFVSRLSLGALIDWKGIEWQNRAHFFGVCAQLMRRILVDFARRRPQLEGKEALRVSLDDALNFAQGRDPDLVALDDALTALAALDPRKSRVVELRYFGGLSVEETAEVLQIAPITVMREWTKAKLWLHRELQREP